MNIKSFNEESYSDLNIQSKQMIREKDISNNMIDSMLSVNTNMGMQSDSRSTICLIINSFFL